MTCSEEDVILNLNVSRERVGGTITAHCSVVIVTSHDSLSRGECDVYLFKLIMGFVVELHRSHCEEA